MRADMGRIRRSKMIYIGVVILLLNMFWQTSKAMAEEGVSAKGIIDGIHHSVGSTATPAVLLVVPIFMAVFANDLSARSMQCVLGHGTTRDKLIVTKILEAAILLAVEFLVLTALTSVFFDEEFAMSVTQQSTLVSYLWITALRYYGYIVFSAMVLYLTGSIGAGIITSVAFALIFKVIFSLVDLFSTFTIYDYTFDGCLDEAYMVIEAGGLGWQIIPAFLYIIVALVVTIVFFRRKEFEF